MRNFQIFMFCCCAVACVDVLAVTEVTEVTGHAGEDVSFRCSGNWTTENSSEHLNVFFCKGMCSRENTIIQSPGTTAAVVRMGRYSLQPIRGDGALEVNITKLKPADAGRYYCGVGDAVIVLYQEVNLKVGNDALTSTTLQAAANTDADLFLPPAEPSPFTQPTARGKTNPRATARLSETMVVITISVSLALLVCAIIPLIFYIHWRSSSEAENKCKTSHAQSDCCAQDVCSHGAVELQAIDVPESGAQRAIYQPLLA
ncbi:uncharacterized protein LOC130527618 isoform X1 [Takifugu flavidus]|uniref:Immunoglobulin domain-containing protein n=1 Tax=Takifugu flavidus TaxID=433684 RepID=A0A5C6MWS7_9TELE|nr:uncharacterized protein LOC130527618 isoform X1 [Takifugu flavidus]TWW59552.1 hypothetical protein D4764_06G0010820 [Takifugu flavidus]